MSFTWEQGPLLGSGGMADVYLAIVKSEKAPRLVAVKRLRAGALDQNLVAQLEREAKIGSLLNHPNVVRVEASGQDEKGPWLAMEYVAGRSARRLVRAHFELARFMEPRIAATLCCDAAKGLAYVHGLHVPDQGLYDLVHRDISSDNILVDLDGHSKLADFGVARIAGIAGLTRAGNFKGKIAYAAPELLEGTPPTHRSDYFAFAATVYELFTGRYAFAGKSEVETLDNLVNKPAPELTNAPPDVAEWVAAAFEKNPKNRPDSLTGLVLALGRMAAPHGDVAKMMREVGADVGVQRADELTTQLSKGPRPPSERWPYAAMAAAALVGVLAVRVVFPVVDDPKPAPAIVALPPPRAQVQPPPAPPPVPVPAPALVKKKPPPAPVAAPSPRFEGPTAKVKFNVKPWGYVWFEGKRLGIAPLELEIPLGRQTFEIRNPELERVVMTALDVREGETNELNLDLHE